MILGLFLFVFLKGCMENLILFDDKSYKRLQPLTFTRPVGEIRVGILTIREKWELWFNNSFSYLTTPHLSTKYKFKLRPKNIVINGSVLPCPSLCAEIAELAQGDALIQGTEFIAANISDEQFKVLDESLEIEGLNKVNSTADFIKINHPWDIFKRNGEAIELDFEKITRDRTSEPLSDTNMVIGDPSNIFLEPGAMVEGAILNCSKGPIYVGKDAEIMEGSVIRGPLAMCEQSVVKLGAKIYGPTTIGPSSKVGGEVNNCVFIGYANKGHDGFLGNSVIGEWCNLGADTNNSNLKNNYADVRLWNYASESFVTTGLQFCGLIMGDHSKCGINTMFNTGTVVGVSANIFGAGFPRNFIPSFAWGGASGLSTYRLTKAFETAELVMARRGKTLDQTEKDILEYIFKNSRVYRRWENV